jgi:hypothetical protein
MHDRATAERLRGQLMCCQILPANMGERDQWERSGLQRLVALGWGLVVDAACAPLFLKVTYPPDGWSIRALPPTRPNATSCWGEILDAADRVRGHVFYYPGSHGAGGSPPNAHLALVRRFNVTRIAGAENYTTGIGVYDAGRLVHRVGEYPDLLSGQFRSSGDMRAAVQTREELARSDYREAATWLRDRAPDHEDPLAYWGDGDGDILSRG